MSACEQSHIITPSDTNGRFRLFGGQLASWIDVVACVVARRHSECEVTTACIDSLDFRAAALLNDTVVVRGKLSYVGKTSMEVKVETYTEPLGKEPQLINTAFVVLVALDDNHQPIPVPRLEIETLEQKEEFERGKQRAKMRKARRQEG